ncbi:MAG: CerR family C-terminal domain-containing protein [Vicinamibacterales bacterium]
MSTTPATETPARDDAGTRERLVTVAADLFADRGFQRVTVREICAAAGANVAAVNYHFGDKEGLYRAVVQEAIRIMRETHDLSAEAGRGVPVEEQLAAFIRVFLSRLTGHGRLSWIHKLMVREMDQPGEALRLVVREVIEPRIAYLSGLIGTIAGLPADDPRVLRAALSIQAQCLVFARPLPPHLPAALSRVRLDVDAAATHIAAFSIAALHRLHEQPA